MCRAPAAWATMLRSARLTGGGLRGAHRTVLHRLSARMLRPVIVPPPAGMASEPVSSAQVLSRAEAMPSRACFSSSRQVRRYSRSSVRPSKPPPLSGRVLPTATARSRAVRRATRAMLSDSLTWGRQSGRCDATPGGMRLRADSATTPAPRRLPRLR